MSEKQRIALGCMGMSGVYGKTDDTKSIAVIHAAIAHGITLLDTGDFYASGHNELLIGKAIAGRRDKVQLSVKFGMMRGPDGAPVGVDTRPAAVKNFLTYSLMRLGTDHVDVYRPARLDPTVPIEDTVGAIADLVKAGYVRKIGLSEVGPETLRRAAKVHPIADLQIEYSLVSRDPEDAIFPILHELGMGATLYGVLSRGLLPASPLQPGDARAHMPRFSGDNAAANARLVAALRDLAEKWGLSPGQLAIGYVLGKAPRFTPTLGMRTLEQLDEALAAKPLTADQITQVEKLVPRGAIAGTRYPAAHMAHLDSERR
ncbi:aldo/keto reductase [Archangium primigenium]|uniref:aldo/keto reductase n=1 Tax=[Archangium] primigenium TaxID=2792470 RepID=UPI00195E556E|nr:aldo/keto reductase [Archangium primigenium]MBM7114453.1 aldo/keto reductase [Archangium primigenium]